MMKKLFYFFVAMFIITSCTDDIEPWEKDPINLEIRFVVETPQEHNSIITTKINDGSNGEIDVYVKEEGPDNLPYSKEYLGQKVNYYTFTEFTYKDRTISGSIAEYEAFESYNVTLKMYINGELKEQVAEEITKPDDTVNLFFEFKEYFE